jgi:hypothetical protein
MKQKQYYFVYLEIALRGKRYPYIYGYQNISAIPTKKLVEILEIDLTHDQNISEGYFLTSKMYKKHMDYLQPHLPSMNFNVFEYCVRFYSGTKADIRKDYKENYWE